MAFCVNCGSAVGEADVFCGKCGTRQAAGSGAAGSAPAQPATNPLDAMPARTAGMLCYVPMLGIIMSIIVLASERYRRDVVTRFHAFQGLFLFVAYQVADKVLRPFLWGGAFGFNPIGLLKLAIIGGGIYLLIATQRGEKVKLPIVGDLAERSASEQE
jgi:uncharacterized membrane protein